MCLLSHLLSTCNRFWGKAWSFVLLWTSCKITNSGLAALDIIDRSWFSTCILLSVHRATAKHQYQTAVKRVSRFLWCSDALIAAFPLSSPINRSQIIAEVVIHIFLYTLKFRCIRVAPTSPCLISVRSCQEQRILQTLVSYFVLLLRSLLNTPTSQNLRNTVPSLCRRILPFYCLPLRHL